MRENFFGENIGDRKEENRFFLLIFCKKSVKLLVHMKFSGKRKRSHENGTIYENSCSFCVEIS